MSKKIKVMLVDDSAVIRGLISRHLDTEPSIEIVASVSNGQMAVNMVEKAAPDVIVLDIEMPIMDGITAIPLLIEKNPEAKILMCSTLSEKGAEITLKALTLGATDCIVKPTTSSGIASGEDFKVELIRLIKTLGPVNISTSPASQTTSSSTADPANEQPIQKFSLRSELSDYKGKPDLIAVGSSTGGPQALFSVLPHFKGFNIPIVITQHMPKTFTTILAQHIQTNCNITCHEGAEGMKLENGVAYVAPGGYHMELRREKLDTFITLSEGPPENFCKPSVDPMMRSAIEIYGRKVLGVMLTGMGNDGKNSFTDLAKLGGMIVAQDEETSVVWGMPGAVANNNICSAVLPLNEIGPWVNKAVTG